MNNKVIHHHGSCLMFYPVQTLRRKITVGYLFLLIFVVVSINNSNSLEITWISGSQDLEQPGVYGEKGEANPSNVPGARRYAVSWKDSENNLFLFGGEGVANNPSEVGSYSVYSTGVLNDLEI